MLPPAVASPESLHNWSVFVKQCFKHRLGVDEFRKLSKRMFIRNPIKGDYVIDQLLEVRASYNFPWDPLLPAYADCLCKSGHAKTSTTLSRVLSQSTIKGVDENRKNKYPTLMTDIKVINDAILSISAGIIPKSLLETAELYDAAIEWLNSLVAWHTNILHQPAQNGALLNSSDAVTLIESAGIFLAALSGSPKGLEWLTEDIHKGLKVKLGRALTAYLPLCLEISLPLRHRLDAIQKDFNLFGQIPSKGLDHSTIEGMNVNALQFEASVMDSPMINTRAGLYVYLNSMLVGRPLVDDLTLINYLNNRYEGHNETIIMELITAAFDVLSNGVYRSESNRTMFLFRSFLVNKLPAFFAALTATSMVPLNVEMCVSQALSRLDPNAFPSFSQMFSMQGNSILSDARQEFLFACASHRLIPESSIERLLGENPMQTLPVGGPYQKDDLVMQIHNNPGRADQLIGEIESMEGNAGAIVGAITEVMFGLCNSRETITLKNICNALSRRPQALDVILLFRTTKQILQPLCALLDSWRWDEEQGENQPVYDEFGSVLLLVLAFKYRYDLSPSDLGISNNDSFVLKLLDHGSCSQKLVELSEKQNKDLGVWIAALFNSEGLGEETMSACSPQEFYMLVATLFDQSLGACESGRLDFETLKGGFEYLLEPFLLPSLVVALTWLGNHIWESETDPTIGLKTLQSLIKPSSISGEAQAIHQTVLSITARPLEERLKDVRTRNQTRSDIKPALDALDPYLSFRRVGSCVRSELEAWSTQKALVLWSTNSEIHMAPSSYSHRQILAGIRLLGSTRVACALIDEVKQQTETGNGDLALDIAASMMCAPMPESFAVDQNICHPVDSNKESLPRCSVLTLRDALAIQHENVPKLSERDPLRAAAVVRLWRRVSLLAAPPSQVSNIDVSNIMQNMDYGVDSQGRMDLTFGREYNAAAAAAAGMDNSMDAGMGLGQDMDLGADPTGLDAIDDVLNAADMAVGNPEFLDLDMEGMF
ncbi:hypothetical protein N7470_002915 [Penicillium chermesinum]|nr:hypothetical protein N7470_002915 [Penicillium chermesinum]